VRIVFRDFPLSFHQQAQGAAEAAQCAHAQGKFWEYHDRLFANQRDLTPEALKRHAAEMGLDAAQFSSCLDAGASRAQVTADFQDGTRFGVTGTPAFFVNGRFVNGAVPFDQFARIIDDELERKGIAVPAN
jgi:protein-disulfide isomerase